MTEPKFSCLSSKLFDDKSIFRLSWNSISSHRSCSKTFPNFVPAESQLHLIKTILNNSIICLSRKSIAFDRKCSRKIPNCVWVKIQVHLIEINPREFRIVSMLESQCISSNLFYDSFKFCPGRNSIAFYRKLSKTNPIWVWALIQLHPIEYNLRQFHVESQSKFNCILSRTI